MSGVTTNAPVPSKHLFLHQVANEPRGTKVRFLCCVLAYEVPKAYLHVEHRWSRDANHTASTAVEIMPVLGSVKSTDLQAGSWLNVIGYVHRSLPGKHKRRRADELAPMLEPQVVVQAILIWNAGALKIAEYEWTLSHQQEARRLAAESRLEPLRP